MTDTDTKNPLDGASGSGWHAPLPERLPNPTASPAVLGFGASLLTWGLLTSWIISAVGLVVFGIGVSAWISEMRNEQGD